MEQGRKIEVLKPFGPTIAKTNIPEDIVNKLNEYVEELIKDEKKIKSQNHGDKLAGNVTQEFSIDKEFAKKIGWLDFLYDVTHKWIEVSSGKSITEFNLLESWIVRQFANEYNKFSNSKREIAFGVIIGTVYSAFLQTYSNQQL